MGNGGPPLIREPSPGFGSERPSRKGRECQITQKKDGEAPQVQDEMRAPFCEVRGPNALFCATKAKGTS